MLHAVCSGPRKSDVSRILKAESNDAQAISPHYDLEPVELQQDAPWHGTPFTAILRTRDLWLLDQKSRNRWMHNGCRACATLCLTCTRPWLISSASVTKRLLGRPDLPIISSSCYRRTHGLPGSSLFRS